MTFPYIRVTSQIIRPIVPINLKAGSQTIKLDALIDSGADYCIFPLKVAKDLKLFFRSSDKTKFHGIGKAEGYWHQIEITVGNTSYKTKAVFADLKNMEFGVLGQKGFFDHFDVTLSYKNHSIELQPV